jgi:hypothetical protein
VSRINLGSRATWASGVFKSTASMSVGAEEGGGIGNSTVSGHDSSPPPKVLSGGVGGNLVSEVGKREAEDDTECSAPSSCEKPPILTSNWPAR